MTRDDVFRELVRLIERSGRSLDTTTLCLDNEPFSVHGIDSMCLMRLIGDVERKFTIELNDSDAFLASSFDGLVTLILQRLAEGPTDEQGIPARRNFFDVLQRRATLAGSSAELRLRTAQQDDIALTHERLLRIAAHLGHSIPQPEDSRPQVVLVAAVNPLTTMLGFLAALSVEAVPLILPHPKALGGFEAYLEQIRRLVGYLGHRPVMAVEPGLLPDRKMLRELPVVELPLHTEVAAAAAVPFLPPPSSRQNGADDIAFLQATSASTGDARLVAITHANICANLDAMTADLSMSPGAERTCSWLPLYHDMGLIGATLFPLYGGFSTILMRPNDFIKQPALWLRTLDEFRVTFTGAPNFALDYASMTLSDADLEGVDLSCVRSFGLAAEPIQRATVQRWLDRFGPYGFRADAFVPGLGMAESTLSTTTRVGREPRYVVVDTAGAVVGEPIRILGRGVCTYPAQPVPDLPDGGTGVAVFSLGTPLDGLRVHLCDEEGTPVSGEHRVGEICVVGTSVAGYYDPGSGTPAPVTGGTLHSGDLGFFDSGELFVLERMKNVVIRNGVNHIASLLEQQVADVFGVLAHTVLIVDEDIHDPTSRIHVVIELADHLPAPTTDQLAVLRRLDLRVDVVTFVRGLGLPRTTSGKKRYHVCRQRLLAGEFDIAQQVHLA